AVGRLAGQRLEHLGSSGLGRRCRGRGGLLGQGRGPVVLGAQAAGLGGLVVCGLLFGHGGGPVVLHGTTGCLIRQVRVLGVVFVVAHLLVRASSLSESSGVARTLRTRRA